MIKVKQTIGNTTQTEVLEYAHMIEPLKGKNGFLPNWVALNNIKKANEPVNILLDSFRKYQKEGKAILVNRLGGWCSLTKDMEILK